MKPLWIFLISLVVCLGAVDADDPPPVLTAADVQSVVQNAAQSVNTSAMVIAVTDLSLIHI